MTNLNGQSTFNRINYTQDYRKYLQKEHLKKKSNGVGFYVLAYFGTMNAVVVAITMIFTIVQVLQGKDTNYVIELLTNTNSEIMHFMTIIASVFAAVFPAFFYLGISKNHLSDCIKTKFVKPTIYFPLLFIGLAVAMIANIASEMVSSNFSIFGLENNLDFSNSSSSLFCNILYVVSTAVTPAFAEEFAFRGIFLGALRKYGDSFAIITSALMFGAMHGNIIQIPFAFMLGLILGFITCKTNSIIPAITIHFLNNFYAVILDIMKTEKLVTEHTFYLISYIFIFAFCILGIISLFLILRKDKNFLSINDHSEIVTLTFKEKIICFLSNPGVIISLSFFFIETIMYLCLI